MGIPPMALNHKLLMSFKPEAKPYKKSDEKGLFVLVNPNGSLYWRFKYRLN